MPKKKPYEAPLQRAISAVRAGRPAEARRLLATLLLQNPNAVEAWVWMGKAQDDLERRRECFQRALHLDPGNMEAREGLVALMSGPQPDTGKGEPARISACPFPCASCGAHLRYDAVGAAMRCSHCGTVRPLPGPSGPPAWLPMPPVLPSEAQIEPAGRELLRCRFCGATTELSIRTASLSCPFCGSPQVVQQSRGTFLVPPQAVVPFRLDRAAAEQALRDWFGQRWEQPGDLARKAEIVDLGAAYLPFWMFSGWVKLLYRGVIPQDRGSTNMPMLTSTLQPVPVQDVLVPSSFSLDEAALRKIEPFDLQAAVPFRPEYLAGWPAQVYQVAMADASIQARERMTREARSKARHWVPTYDSPDLPDSGPPQYELGIGDVQLDAFRHLLLPVWLGTYRYRGKAFRFAINGQTGKVGGESPVSAGAIGLVAACGAVALAFLVLLLVRFRAEIAGLLRGLRSPEGVQAGPSLPVAALIAAIVVFLIFDAVALWPGVRQRLKGRRQEEEPHAED